MQTFECVLPGKLFYLLYELPLDCVFSNAHIDCIETHTTRNKQMANIIKRSNTGKYHLGSDRATNTDCNQRMFATPSSTVMALKAPESMICEKCFNGRYKGHEQIRYMLEIDYIKK